MAAHRDWNRTDRRVKARRSTVTLRERQLSNEIIMIAEYFRVLDRRWVRVAAMLWCTRCSRPVDRRLVGPACGCATSPVRAAWGGYLNQMWTRRLSGAAAYRRWEAAVSVLIR